MKLGWMVKAAKGLGKFIGWAAKNPAVQEAVIEGIKAKAGKKKDAEDGQD